MELWRAPLAPVALAFTAGIVLDRQASLPLPGYLFAAAVALVAWIATFPGRSRGLGIVYLCLAVVPLGAAYHQFRRDTLPADDVSHVAGEDAVVVELRGVLDEEPVERWHPLDDPLYSPRRNDEEEPAPTTVTVLSLRRIKYRGAWEVISGRVQMVVAGTLPDLHEGDEVETVGKLFRPSPPANPGERDWASELRDRGIRGVLRVEATAGSVVRLDVGSGWSPSVLAARIRGWGVRQFREALPDDEARLASALVLGEGSILHREAWDRFTRTGVVHVLVISGAHLFVLAAFLWFCLTVPGVRQRRGVLVVLAILWAYTLVAGFRPPLLRATVSATVFAGALLLRRPVALGNAFALAWLVVLILNPADVSDTGCLLSFLCVAGLYWNEGRSRTERREVDPLEKLLDESRPAWQRWLRGFGRFLLVQYAVCVGLWFVVAPLAVARTQFLPVTGLLIGPPIIWLTSLALITGFLLLLASALLPPLVPVLAGITELLLKGCEGLVGLFDGFWVRPGYVGDVPGWWLIGYYLLLSSSLIVRPSWRSLRRVALLAAAWLGVGLLAGLVRPGAKELRVTFLSVGHGGCTVLETPDGRTLLYDAGSMAGPGVARWQIAPYLWSRGIRRIDEVFLSHADLDHYNGLRDLAERFPIGQVSCTPTFRGRGNKPVLHVLARLEKESVPVREVSEGDVLRAGDVTLEVLYPPREGAPAGPENERSLVLLVTHGKHRILLTGDLEGEGLRRLVEDRERRTVDVLMAPHHGSARIGVTVRNIGKEGPARLMDWARPHLVVSCQGLPRRPADGPNPYTAGGARFLATGTHGAVTVHSHVSGISVETFLTGERFVVRSPR